MQSRLAAMATIATVILRPARHKSVRQHHPWIFSGALATLPAHLAPGATVEVLDADRQWLARGAYSPHSQIAIRLWTWDETEAIDEAFFYRRLQNALLRRQYRLAARLTAPDTAIRLVNAEADGLPGLIIDRYGDYAVLQSLTAGIERWKTVIVQQLQRLIPVKGIYERADAEVRQKEGLPLQKGVLAGTVPTSTIIREQSLYLQVDMVNGHKTGLYLDQAENRQRLMAYTDQAEVLNCFAYQGAFGLYALQGGATQLTNVELSATALAHFDENLRLNPTLAKTAIIDNQQADVFACLRQYRQAQRSFDVIILDPPKFAESRSQLTKALRGYKDINWLALRLLRPGGILMTFSCSGLLEADLFQKVVADAALDAQRETRILEYLGQATDHAIALNFPEGRYLKGLICQVD